MLLTRRVVNLSPSPEGPMPRTALFPGSFDPLTLGHVNLIERGLGLFDRVIVGIAVNIRKSPLFTFEERAAFINASFPTDRVEVTPMTGLLVEEARARQCAAILRGIRTVGDFEYEHKMTSMNRALAPELDTVFLMAEPEHVFVSSSLIKEVARFGGDIRAFVPEHVADPLVERLSRDP